MKGQADTIGIAMRRALLGEIKGTCITRAKSEKVSHEYSTIVGIEELVLTTILGHLHNIQRNRARGDRHRTLAPATLSSFPTL